jgi:oligopeptide transport system ATP-binding protein
MSCLEIQNVSVQFAKNSGFFTRKPAVVQAVKDVSISVKSGSIFGIVGESGSGKTTLARTIVGLVKAAGGTILLDGKPIDSRSSHVQMVFQDPYGSLNPRMTVLETLEEPLIVHTKFSKDERLRRVMDTLGAVGLSDDALHRYPHEFSGGQRQRIGIARALMLQPKVLICDEAVAALDVSIQGQILNLLVDLNRTMQLTIIFISHDISVVRYLCDEIAVMYLGHIVESGAAADVLDHPKHPYTRELLSAVPKIDISVMKHYSDTAAPQNPEVTRESH